MKKFLYILAVVGAIVAPARGDAAWLVRRSFRILDLNMDGVHQHPSALIGIAWFLGSQAMSHSANVVTLQEVCASQYSTILAGLRNFDVHWTGTYKNFGTMQGCAGSSKRHGLAIFTKGAHSDLEWKYLEDDGYWNPGDDRWWGVMKVHYRGVDIFNTHIMSGNKDAQIPQVERFVQQSPLFLLAGDFNTAPGEGLIDPFYDRWFEIDEDREYTHPRWVSPNRRKIDYVWSNREPIYRGGDVIDAYFSNHRMVKGFFTHWVSAAQ